MQDRDGAFRITAALREAFSTITLVSADAGHRGRFVRDARKISAGVVPRHGHVTEPASRAYITS